MLVSRKLHNAWQSEDPLLESTIMSLGAHCISTGAAAQTLECIHVEIQKHLKHWEILKTPRLQRNCCLGYRYHLEEISTSGGSMKSNPWGGGSAPSIQNMTNLSEWEYGVIESIGRVIGFGVLRKIMGRIWSYLYLNGPTTSKDLRDKLGISKGGISMLLSDLENWKIIKRI